MLTLTAFERGIHRILITRARGADGNREKALITYGELAALLTPIRREGDPSLQWPYGGFYEAIGHVSMYEVEHGRPMLSAIVVNTDTRIPEEGFIKLARHLLFEVQDEDEFWEDEVDEVIDVWRPDSGIAVVDRALEIVDDRLRNVQRALRRGTNGDGAYVARTLHGTAASLQTPEPSISVFNVGVRPVVDGIYLAMLPIGPCRSETFHLSPGAAADLPLLKWDATYDTHLGELVDGIAEFLAWGDGTGRWTVVRPHLSQRPEFWTEGTPEPPSINWLRMVRQYIARGEAADARASATGGG